MARFKAKELGLLKDTEVTRLACLYLACVSADNLKVCSSDPLIPQVSLTSVTPSAAAYMLASVEAGNTLSSFKVLTQKTMKELREQCTIQEGESIASPAVPTTPKTTTPGRKRKVDNAETPSRKKATGPKKDVAVKMEDSAVEEPEE